MGVSIPGAISGISGVGGVGGLPTPVKTEEKYFLGGVLITKQG